MNTISVSYNFPTGFLWGSTPPEDALSETNNSAYLFRLQEKSVRALIIEIKWARCEPLKEQFDEGYIESRRSLLARIKSRNIEPVVILDSREFPQWMNLNHPGRSGSEAAEAYPFYVHLTDALLPYTNFIGLHAPQQGLFNGARVRTAMDVFRQTADHIHELSENTKAGLILPRDFGTEKASGVDRLFGRNEYHYLRKAEADFLGLPAGQTATAGIRSVLGENRIPLMFITDRLRSGNEEDRFEILADTLYDIWQLYQQGIRVLGYFSETDFNSDSPDTNLYEFSCKNNSLKLSTDMPELPEKWIRFLKD